MEYMSTAEASECWGVSLRQVQRLLADKRIPHAKKYGRSWMIPVHAEKPMDLRKERNLSRKTLLPWACVVFATTVPYLRLKRDSLRRRWRATGAAVSPIWRGETPIFRVVSAGPALPAFHKVKETVARLRSCPAAIAAAISTGDYRTYTEIDAYLRSWVKSGKGSHVSAVAEMSLAAVAVSVVAPDVAPNWLKAGDLSALPPSVRPNALYLRAKYFHCTGRFEAMLAVAQTALSLGSSQEGLTHYDIYLRLMCAVACRHLRRHGEARRWLLDIMGTALPHGFVTPFSELVTALGGLMEQCLLQEFPGYYDAVIEQWNRTWKNWIAFHNQFRKDNITLILSLREYHLASLVAQRVPYARIAERYSISVGRLKNIMQDIYSKTHIQPGRTIELRLPTLARRRDFFEMKSHYQKYEFALMIVMRIL